MSAYLQIATFGVPRILRDGHPVDFEMRKAIALLVYLAMNGQSVSRAHLVDLLWPNFAENKARANLRRTLSSLRAAIGDEQVVATHEYVGLNAELMVDALHLMQIVDDISKQDTTATADTIAELQAAVDAAQADFLAGLMLQNTSTFEEWVSQTSQYLNNVRDTAYSMLCYWYAIQRQYTKLLPAAEQWSSRNPLDDKPIYYLLLANALQGNRSRAIQQFEAFEQRLRAELDIMPLPINQGLYMRLLDGDVILEAELNPERDLKATPISQPKIINSLPLTFDRHRKFYGRQAMVAYLREQLASRARVIVVFGKSGIGKTALVSKVIADMLATQADLDGVVCLSGHNEDGTTTPLNLNTIITDFQHMLGEGLTIDATQPIVQQVALLLDATSRGNYILYLDNLEGLQHDDHTLCDDSLSALLSAILTQGGLSVVITSQLPLKLQGVGQSGHVLSLPLETGLSPADAQTFVRNLLSALPDHHEISEDDIHTLATLTDGHPRALEAATDWLADNLLAGMDTLFIDVEQQQGDVIEFLVGHAISSLSRDMQRILQCIAIFNQPAPLNAVQAIIAPFLEDAASIQVLLNRLVLRRFVRFDAPTRTLDLHTIDRNYSLARLPENSGDEATYGRYALLRRGASYFESIRKPETEWKKYADLLPQLFEYEFRLHLDQYNAAGQIINSISNRMSQMGYIHETMERLQAIVHVADDYDVLANAQNSLGLYYHRRYETDKALATLEEAIKNARLAGNQHQLARALGNRGSLVREFEQRLHYYELARNVFEDIGDQAGVITADYHIGLVHLNTLRTNEAIAILEKVYARAQALEHYGVSGNALGALAVCYIQLARFDEAVAAFEQATELATAAEDFHFQANWSGKLYDLHHRLLGNDEIAKQGFPTVLEVAQRAGGRTVELETRIQMARLTFDTEDQHAALHMLQRLFDAEPTLMKKSYAHEALMELSAWTGNYQTAAKHATILEEQFLQLASPYYGVLCAVSLMSGDDETTRERCSRLMSLSHRYLKSTPGLYSQWYNLGLQYAVGVLLGDNELSEALATYQQAYALCNAPGVLREQRRWLELLLSAPNGAQLQPLRAALD